MDEEPPADRVLPWSPLAIGVTSVLATLNKPALVGWAAKMAAEFAVDNAAAWQALPDRTAKVELIKGASRRSAGDAAETGTDAHAIAEDIGTHLFLGGPKPAIPSELAGFAKSYLRFLKECKAKPVMLEKTVWNHTFGYAGTFDGLYEVDGKLVIIDTKTGKSGIWPETALQQVAYRRAEVIVDVDGNETPMPETEGALALWLRPEGYALHPLVTNERTWECFQALITATAWKNDVGALAVRKPINPAPLRK